MRIEVPSADLQVSQLCSTSGVAGSWERREPNMAIRLVRRVLTSWRAGRGRVLSISRMGSKALANSGSYWRGMVSGS